MSDEPPEGGRLELRHQRMVDLCHGPTSVDGRDACATRFGCDPASNSCRRIDRECSSNDRADKSGEPLRPGLLARPIPDQVLADLDQGVDEPPGRGVLPQAVTNELARVGLIVADDEATFCV